MRDVLIPVLLWASTIGSAVMAGLYFAFSAFIMTAFQRIGQESGVAAMNAINSVIQRSLFMPIFLGSTLTAAGLAIAALANLAEPWARPALAGALLYVIGMFVVTMVWNVPLNNRLSAMDPASVEAAPVWAAYLKDWTRWNSIRTVASFAAFILFILSIRHTSAG